MKMVKAVTAWTTAAITYVSMTLLGAGLAGADAGADAVGQRYAEAEAGLSAAGLQPVIATVVGDKIPHDQCFVVSTSQQTFLDGNGSSKGDLILVNLNCYPKPATATNPGFSAANNAPDAAAVRDTEKQEYMAWIQTADGQEWCHAALVEHPEWGGIEGC